MPAAEQQLQARLATLQRSVCGLEMGREAMDEVVNDVVRCAWMQDGRCVGLPSQHVRIDATFVYSTENVSVSGCEYVVLSHTTSRFRLPACRPVGFLLLTVDV